MLHSPKKSITNEGTTKYQLGNLSVAFLSPWMVLGVSFSSSKLSQCWMKPARWSQMMGGKWYLSKGSWCQSWPAADIWWHMASKCRREGSIRSRDSGLASPGDSCSCRMERNPSYGAFGVTHTEQSRIMQNMTEVEGRKREKLKGKKAGLQDRRQTDI